MNQNTKKFLIGAAACLVLGGSIVSCKKDKVTVAPPDPIGGFNNAGEVGGTNLKAYWSFDGTNNESISSVAPATAVRNSFAAGIKGQALNLDSGFLLYPSIPNLNVANLGSVTVSAWINTQNRPNGGPSSVFALTTGTATQAQWNDAPVLLMLENGRPQEYNDTLVLKGTFASYIAGVPVRGDNINDYGVRGTDFKTVLGANRWVHFVYRWDGASSTIDLYADGIRVSNNNFRVRDNAGSPIGGLVSPTPTQVIIGGFANAVTGFMNSTTEPWHNMFKGQIDEVRFYTTALSETDISSLYQLEKAGR